MGKHGPKPGTVYTRRIWMAERLRVESDRQLVAAQHFNDRLDRFIEEIDTGGYPAGQIDPRAVQRLIQALEAVQGAVIGGIESYLVRGVPIASTVPMATAASTSKAALQARRKRDVGSVGGRLPAEDVLGDG